MKNHAVIHGSSALPTGRANRAPKTTERGGDGALFSVVVTGERLCQSIHVLLWRGY
jgi:hypothetical protein